MAPEPPFPYTPGPTPEPLVPSYVVVLRYLEQANVARQGCPVDLVNDKERQHPSVLLWLGCLFVVKEGWTSDRLRDDAVKFLLRKNGFVTLLGTARDVAFHYEPSLILRWSRLVGQFGGRVKLGSGCCQAASLSITLAPYASSGVRPANVE